MTRTICINNYLNPTSNTSLQSMQLNGSIAIYVNFFFFLHISNQALQGEASGKGVYRPMKLTFKRLLIQQQKSI